MTGTDDAWKALSQANDWIKVADTKAGAIVAVDGVLGGLLVRALPAADSWTRHPWQAGAILGGLTLVVAGALIALRVFAPRLRAGEPRSLIYFDHIARRYPKAADFKVTFIAMLDREGQLREALAEQLWANSRVARKKFRRVAVSLWLLAGALVVALCASLLQGH